MARPAEASSSPPWTLLSTRSWHADLRRCDETIHARVDGFLRHLRRSPFAPGTNLKPLAGRPHTYRWRSGDFRLTYHIDQASRTVLLLRLGNRSDVYRSVHVGEGLNIVEPGKPITGGRKLLVQLPPTTIRLDSPPTTAPTAPTAESVPIEQAEPIVTPEELFLIGVPQEWWAGLARVTSEEALRQVAVPEDVRSRVLDYCTNPAATQIGRLYALQQSATCADMARRPLHEFLVRLDPAQQALVDLPPDRAPLLIRGGPGTGKSLVALRRLHKLIVAGTAVQLFDATLPRRYAFITYTKSLAVASQQLFARLIDQEPLVGVTVEFKTLDGIARSLVPKTDLVDGRHLSLRVEKDEYELRTYVHRAKQRAGADAVAIVERLGAAYVLDEFEQVLEGRALRSQHEYLEHDRSGRRVPLREAQRSAIYAVYREYARELSQTKLTTFGALRMQALDAADNIAPERQYDGIVVDEAQDMSVTGLRICAALLRRPQFVTLVLDAGQALHVKVPVWRNVHPAWVFGPSNSRVLERTYRMTLELRAALAPWRQEVGDGLTDPTADEGAAYSGPRPVLRWVPQGHQASRVADLVVSYLPHVHPSAIAIIHAHPRASGHRFVKALTKQGIAARVIVKKSELRLDGDEVLILSPEAAKGLEFPYVIVPDVNAALYPEQQSMGKAPTLEAQEELQAAGRRRLYVAASRAAHHLELLVPRETPSPYIKELQLEAWDVVHD